MPYHRRPMRWLPAVLTAAVALSVPVRAEDPALLLEKAVYTEQTSKDDAAAEKLYRAVIAAQGANAAKVAEARYRLGDLLLRGKKTAEARAVWQELIANHPTEKKWIDQARAAMGDLPAAGGQGKWIVRLAEEPLSRAAFEALANDLEAAGIKSKKPIGLPQPEGGLVLPAYDGFDTKDSAHALARILQEQGFICKVDADPRKSDAVSAPSTASSVSESELGLERDASVAKNDFAAALTAEEKRVSLRLATGHAYADKLTFEGLVDAFGKRKGGALTAEELAAFEAEVESRLQALAGKDGPMGAQRGGDPLYWRYHHLLASLAASQGDSRTAITHFDECLAGYPETEYKVPSKFGKFQHIVQERAAQVWKAEGQEAAEDQVIELLGKERIRYRAFYPSGWEQLARKQGATPQSIRDFFLRVIATAEQRANSSKSAEEAVFMREVVQDVQKAIARVKG